jgi:hypothetical protein
MPMPDPAVVAAKVQAAIDAKVGATPPNSVDVWTEIIKVLQDEMIKKATVTVSIGGLQKSTDPGDPTDPPSSPKAMDNCIT